MNYLKFQYPKVIVQGNYLAGIQLNSNAFKGKMKAANRQKDMPDLFVFKAKHGYHGLFLELKSPKITIFLKNGELSQSVKSQYAMLERLKAEGYYCDIMNDIDAIRSLLDWYLAE